VLAAWGLALQGQATLTLSPQRLRVGEAFALQLSLQSTAARTQKLAVDYAVHHVKADGGRTAKVFKGWTFDLPAHGSASWSRRHAMREITTSRYHAGPACAGRASSTDGSWPRPEFELLPPT
jgi:hypothetical protein